MKVQVYSSFVYKITVNPNQFLKGFFKLSLTNYTKKFVSEMKILSPHGSSFRKMGHFNLVSHRSKVQLAPSTENIHAIKDDHANSKSGYSNGTILQIGKTCKKSLLQKSIELITPLTKRATCHKQNTVIFLVTRPPNCRKIYSNLWFLQNNKKGIKANLKELELFSYKNVSQVFCKILSTHCFFIDHLMHKIINKKTCRITSANPHQLCSH